MTRAKLHEIRRAVEAAFAYFDVGCVSVADAVDVACDYEAIPDDRDRRIVRAAVLRKIAVERDAGLPPRSVQA